MAKIENYFAMTPAARAAKRGSAACRPHHEDWAEHNLVQISDVIIANPWVRQEMGSNLDVSVQRSKDKRTLIFCVTMP